MPSAKIALSFLMVIGIILVAGILAYTTQNTYSSAGFAASKSIALKEAKTPITTINSLTEFQMNRSTQNLQGNAKAFHDYLVGENK